MRAETLYKQIISGRTGIWSAPVRATLSALSCAYTVAINRRNARFDRGEREVVELPVGVISIGNITTGGTGKTPLVIEVARRCIARGRRPAVIARGYGSHAGGMNDELQMVSECLPNVICVADPDRVRAGRDAMRAGADVLVLDDGFQHRRIARDLDIVLVDATNPFGYGSVLPRGLLREPVAGLGRADVIVVTHAEQVDADGLDRLVARLKSIVGGVPVIVCRHRSVGLTDVSGVTTDQRFRRAVVFAGIGNPLSLVNTVRSTGIDVVETIWWPDHHRYDQSDIARVVAVCDRVDCDVVLTTHKDAVKLRRLNLEGIAPLRIVRIDIDFTDESTAVLDARLEAVLARRGVHSSGDNAKVNAS